MSFDLAVWHGEAPLAAKDALALYVKLCEGHNVPDETHPSVEAFYSELCRRYPEIDTLSEDDLDECPWSCSHDRSGFHVIVCMNYGKHSGEAARVVVELADAHGLICFNPQGSRVYLPPNLKPQRSWFRFW